MSSVHKSLTLAAVAIACLGLTTAPIDAATFNKAQNSTALNLDGSWVETGQPGASDTAKFSSTGTTADIGANLQWNGIASANNKLHTINDTAGNRTLTLGSGGIASGGANGFQVDFFPAVKLGADQTWFFGKINDSLDTQGFDWTVKAAATNRVIIDDAAPILGGGNVIVDGAFTLGGNRNYTGSTTVNSNGSLYLQHENALGDSSTRVLNLNNGGSVGPSEGALALAGTNPTPIVLSGSGGRIFFDSNTIIFGTGPQVIDINSDISGTGGLVVDVLNLRNNANRVVDATFGGDNTYNGATTLRTTGKPTANAGGFHSLIVRNGLNDALPTGTVLTFDNRESDDAGVRQPISYDLNGFNQEVAGLTQVANQATVGFLDANAVVNSSSTAAVLSVNNSTAYTFDGWLGVDNYSGSQAFPETGDNFDLTKSGSGTLTLTADNSYDGPTQINGGSLLVNGNHTGGGVYTVNPGGTLGGSGTINSLIQGDGQISPGNSPGILTVAQVDPTTGGGMDFSFQFNGTAPDYGMPTNSVNNVLFMNDGTNPLIAALTAANIVDLYFATGNEGDAFEGGFYVDADAYGGDSSDFLDDVDDATYNAFVLDALGSVTFDGNSYSLLDPTLMVDVGVVANSDLATNGFVTQFSLASASAVVPEPSAIAIWALLSLGLTGFGVWRARRKE